MAGQHDNRRTGSAVAGINVQGNQAALAVLRERYRDYIAAMRAADGHLLTFACPCCRTKTATLAPEDHDVWDTLATCPWCGTLYEKIVTHDKAKAHIPHATQR